jgi:hypothetical protein
VFLSRRQRGWARRWLTVTTLATVLLAPGLADAKKKRERRFRKRIKEAVTEIARPTIRAAMNDVNDIMYYRLDQVHGIGDDLLGKTDKIAEARIEQLNGSMAERISQITVGGDRIVQRALGRVDAIAKKRIDQTFDRADQLGASLIDRVDEKAEARLDQVDQMLEDRLVDVDNIVQDAIASADTAMAARLEQADEIVGRRLGNVDVMLAKQRLGFERTLMRIGVAAAVFVVSVIFIVWPFRRRRGANAEEAPEKPIGAVPFLVRIMGTTAAALAFLILTFPLVDELPTGAQSELNGVIADHQRGYDESLGNFDFARARFHAAQLEMLEIDTPKERVRMAKIDLMGSVFGRPTSLASEESRAAIEDQFRTVERMMAGEPDPDVLVTHAFVLWQTAESREDEHEAASLCARALRLHDEQFALRPLAENYVLNFLHNPWVTADTPVSRDRESLIAMRKLVGPVPRVPPRFPLKSAIDFDASVRELEGEVIPAYLAMLDRQRDVAALVDQREADAPDSEGLSKAKEARKREAQKVIDAWRRFEAEVDGMEQLHETPAVLGLFRLNDAMLVRALWFADPVSAKEEATAKEAAQAERDAEDAGTELPDVTDDESVGETEPTDLRLPDRVVPAMRHLTKTRTLARLAPPRVAWSNEYGGILGSAGHALLDIEEENRYWRFEDLLSQFDAAYLSSGLTAKTPPTCTPSEAVTQTNRLAAQLGLYLGDLDSHRMPFAAMSSERVARWLAAPDRASELPQSDSDCGVPDSQLGALLLARIRTKL